MAPLDFSAKQLRRNSGGPKQKAVEVPRRLSE
jgi:hypothetical protein